MNGCCIQQILQILNEYSTSKVAQKKTAHRRRTFSLLHAIFRW